MNLKLEEEEKKKEKKMKIHPSHSFWPILFLLFCNFGFFIFQLQMTFHFFVSSGSRIIFPQKDENRSLKRNFDPFQKIFVANSFVFRDNKTQSVQQPRHSCFPESRQASKLNIFREGVGGRASNSAAPGSNLGAPLPSDDVKPIKVVLGEDVIAGRTVVLCKWIVASTRKKY